MCDTIIEHETITQKSDYLLYAKLDNAKVLYNLVKSVNFKEIGLICVLESGLKISCEDSKCTQGIAFVHSGLFQEYKVKEDCICIRLNLNVLIECLNLFGSSLSGASSTALKISYEGYGYPLTLLLEDNGVITECNINTLDAEEIVNFDFDFDNVVNKIIMKSDCLKEVISDIDATNELIEIIVCAEKEFIRFSTYGLIGDLHIDIPSNSEYIESFECKKTQINRYKVSFIKNSLKALAASSKAAIRVSDNGIMSIQFLIQIEDSQAAFSEFYFCPDEDME